MTLFTECQGPDEETRVRVAHCSMVGGRCPACKEDLELEQKIRQLQKRRQELRTKMNANHDPFILKLPLEVASHIFLLSMGARDTSDVSRHGDILPTPFLLGAVCRGWRQLARSTPRLWSKLGFSFFDPTDSTLTTMEALPLLVADWLERSGGLPLTLQVSYQGDCETPPERSVSIINSLNKHSGRWYKVRFALPPNYLERLCGSSPPNLLREFSISDPDEGTEANTPLTFKMSARPSPTNFSIDGFLLDDVDIFWDNLVNLNLCRTTLDGVLKVLRAAPLLEMCSLSNISPPIDDFPIPETVIRLQYLHTLEVAWIEEIEVFCEFMDSLELPSLELWSVEFHGSVLEVDIMVSFLNRSGCSLETLSIWQKGASAIEDFERLLQAAPYLQHLQVRSPRYDSSAIPVMDYILECLSTSPPHRTMQPDDSAGFLTDLQSLKLDGQQLNAWACIPLIFRLPHRKRLKLDIRLNTITISDEISTKLVQLVDQGIELSIFGPSHRDYIQTFKDEQQKDNRSL